MIPRRFFFASVALALIIVCVPLLWPGAVLRVSPDALMKLLGEGDVPTILDVRTAYEFDQEHIPHAMHVSLPTLFFAHDDLAVSRQNNVIVYCGTGIRARIASAYLKLVGFKSVYILDGQLAQWKRDGFPVIVLEDEPFLSLHVMNQAD